MKRALHIGLLLMALIGLIGQSTAMAMAPLQLTASSSNGSMAASMAGADCQNMFASPAKDQSPCKKITLQCIAAMGCSPVAFTMPVASAADPVPVYGQVAVTQLVTRLQSQSYGPEPEPPAILI